MVPLSQALLLTTHKTNWPLVKHLTVTGEVPVAFEATCIDEDGNECSTSIIWFDPDIPNPDNPIGVGDYVAESPGWFFDERPYNPGPKLSYRTFRGWNCGDPKHYQEATTFHVMVQDKKKGALDVYTYEEYADKFGIEI